MFLLPTVLLLGCRDVTPQADADTDSVSDATTTDVAPDDSGGPDEAMPPCHSPLVVFNEVQASNLTTVEDAAGDTHDWIELYNADKVAADLGGWWVSDDADQPGKWVLPSVTLPAGGYLLLFASGQDIGGGVLRWDTKVDLGHTWRYREITRPYDAGWHLPGYDDSTWATGISGFGRGDGDDNTEITGTMAQIRTTFTVEPEELADVVSVQLHVDFDDGFVAWLNGVEIARTNLGIPRTEVPWDALADTNREAFLFRGMNPPEFTVDAALLEEVNTLAVTVVDVSDESSDLSLVPFLTLGYGTQRLGRPSSSLDFTTELHTNFQLGASGETVWLFDDSDCLMDRVEPGPMGGDASYGRTGEIAEPWAYFIEATPRGPNGTDHRPGFAEAPVISPVSGFYPGGVEVTVEAANPKARVVMLEDGYAPHEADPTHPGSVTLDGSAEATVLRARAMVEGLWPSRITTATYLGRGAGPLPILSMVSDPTNLFDWTTGIYALGPGAQPEVPHYGANYWQDWERPLHATLWEPDGSLGFDVSAGIEIHGGWTRAYSQKSLKIKMRNGYGDTRIFHEVFPGLGITEFDNLTVRNGGNDWHGCSPDGCTNGAQMRDGFMHRLTEGVDMDRMSFRPTEVYLNGEYWGVYNLRERPGRRYIESHYGVTDIDLLERNADVIEGDAEHYLTLLHYLRTHDLSDPAVYDTVKTQMEVDQYANYMAFEIWFDNTDWPSNNTRMWRPRTKDGRWRWLLLDLDFGVGLYDAPVEHNTLAHATEPNGPSWPNPPHSTEFFRLMLTSPEFQTTFVNRYADLMNTNLQVGNAQDLLAEMVAEVQPVMGRQFATWGMWTDGTTTHELSADEWSEEVGNMNAWLAARSTFARQHVLDEFGLAGTWDLSLEATPAGSGTFQLAAVSVEPPFTGAYFLGVPVTVTAVPEPGYTFVRWSDGTLPKSPTITVDPATALQLTAVFE